MNYQVRTLHFIVHTSDFRFAWRPITTLSGQTKQARSRFASRVLILHLTAPAKLRSMLSLASSCTLAFDVRSAVLTTPTSARTPAATMVAILGQDLIQSRSPVINVRDPSDPLEAFTGKVVPTFAAAAAADGDETALAPVTQAEVLACQANWAKAIKTISATYAQKGDYIGAAGEAAGLLYGYGHSNVLFKPTKATEHPFRPTGGEAMSYFVGGDVVENGYVGEDAGFAINGGKGWSDVVFTNHQIELTGPTAIAMGSYVFTDATTNDKVTVEYTFGYKRNADGKVRIFLHHSSVPYSP